MKTGIFCNYENHHQNVSLAIEEQSQLIQHAESLGFDTAWITEHHFNDFSTSASILMLIAHLSAITSTIKLGTAALLLPFHQPLRIAEDIATLDHLCKGRLLLGVAKGGPFPEQNKHFNTSVEESRPRTLEALDLIYQLLAGKEVTFSGDYYHCDRLTIHPRPLREKIPTYLATTDAKGIEYAAQRSFFLMGGAPFPLAKLKTMLAIYRSCNPRLSECLMLTRFFFAAKTTDAAIESAIPFIRNFILRMRGNLAVVQANGNQQFFSPVIAFDEASILENSIIGDVATCRDKIKRFQDELSLDTLALKPTSYDWSQNLESLSRFTQDIRPYV